MIEVRPLWPAEVAAAASVIAHGMVDNPIHVAAWPDPGVRLAALTITFSSGIRRPRRWALCAVDDGSIVGVAGIAPDGSCRPSASQAAAVAERLSQLDARAVESYRAWRRAWAERDPDEPHWHLGPFAVAREHRGRGIGGSIMRESCRRLDESSMLGYLEADRVANIKFYVQYGFSVVAEGRVLDVPIHYMARRPRTS